MLCIAKKPRRNRTQLKDYVVLYVYAPNSREKWLWIIVAGAQESLNLLLVLISLPMSLKPYYYFCEGGFHPVLHPQFHTSGTCQWPGPYSRYSNPLILVYISLTINSIVALDHCCSYEDSIAAFALVHPWQIAKDILWNLRLCIEFVLHDCDVQPPNTISNLMVAGLLFYFSGSIPNSDIG
jgi:hypothetical protein